MAVAAVNKRFLWGSNSEHYHTVSNIVEECNTDQLKGKRRSDDPPADREACEHCMRRPLV